MSGLKIRGTLVQTVCIASSHSVVAVFWISAVLSLRHSLCFFHSSNVGRWDCEGGWGVRGQKSSPASLHSIYQHQNFKHNVLKANSETSALSANTSEECLTKMWNLAFSCPAEFTFSSGGTFSAGSCMRSPFFSRGGTIWWTFKEP